MKYYSEITGKLYNTAIDCAAAEQELQAKKMAEQKAKEEAAASRKEKEAELAENVEELQILIDKFSEKTSTFTKEYKELPKATLKFTLPFKNLNFNDLFHSISSIF